MVRRARISSLATYVPPRLLTNADLEKLVETTDEWILQRTGIKTRHIVEPGVGTSDLATEAARKAISRAGLTPDEIDFIVVGTTTPDMVFPSTACLLQAKLGIKQCAAFDLQAVCSGFIYALATADQFIKSGQYRRALVVGAEVYSRILDWKDRGTCVLFGDGAGAVVLSRSDTPGILASRLHADGRYADILCVPGSVDRGAVSGRPLLQMEGNAVFKFAVKVLGEVAEETLAAGGVTKAELDWLIPHQANIRIIQATAKKLGMSMDRVIATVERHANTSAASVPLALDEAIRDGRIRAGHHVLLEGVGGGFTWGAVLLRW
jgi:3-oxoacyl-[acyl-carrier-protein] synthase III